MKKLVTIFSILALVSLGAFMSPINQAAASPLLFDRGLPTSNLNNAAGINRSNFSWAEGFYYGSTPPTTYQVFGDDFSIGSSGSTYHLNKITVWTVDDPPFAYRLLGGLPGAISQVSTSAIVHPVTYSGGAIYQGSAAFYPIYQVDFAIDWTVAGGKLYQFFIDAPLNNYGTAADPAYATSFLHASNAGLSGSPQDGADNLLLLLSMNNGKPGAVTSWVSNGPDFGDKSSDANVQVYGTPLPGTLLLLGSGLLGLAGWRFRRG